MAGFTERLAYIISANGKQAINEFRQVRGAAQTELGKTQSTIKGFGAGAKGFIGGFGAMLAGGALFNFGQEAAASARQVEVWRVKTQTVFEDSADDIREWAKSVNKDMGLTDDELAGLAAAFGDLLKPMGFTAQQAASMSKDVVGLAGALAAWSGGQRTAAETSQILAKAMLGEREGLKELGISILESQVLARVAANDQDKLTGSLLEQAKAVATQELIFEKSLDAQKAWADGSLDAVKSHNKLQAELKESKEEFGEQFAPVEKAARDLGSSVLGVANAAANGVRFAWKAVDVPSKAASSRIRALTGLEKDAGNAAEDAAVGFDKMNRSVKESAETFEEAEVAAKSLADGLDRIEDAAFGVKDAHGDVEAAFEDLAEKEEDWAERRGDAHERYADAVESANRRVRDAEKDVVDAREDLMMLNTGEGRKEARERLADAEERLADAREDSAESIADAKDDLDDVIRDEEKATRKTRERRDELRKITDEVKDAAVEMREHGATEREIIGYLQTQYNRLRDQGTQLGINKTLLQESLDLLKQYEAFIFTGSRPATPIGGGAIQQRGEDIRRQAENVAGLLTGGATNPGSTDPRPLVRVS